MIQVSHFKYKSLSNWNLNIAIGCEHACRFCYVPSASTNKLAPLLKERGVEDPDAQWGDYVFVRDWDQHAFMNSLRKAERTPKEELQRDGNRAVLLCSTTDPYQLIASDRNQAVKRDQIVRFALATILNDSTLRVRILTRSPMARQDFDLMKQFGDRLLFGMSIPTLKNKLARVYEPKAPAPTQRLETLRRAKEAGLNVYAAMAPTYPECDVTDLHATYSALSALEPFTIFHEPINIRAENVERIRKQGEAVGVKLRTGVFASEEDWSAYALEQLSLVEYVSGQIDKTKHLHLWPDKSLAKFCPPGYPWLARWWNRVSEWP